MIALPDPPKLVKGKHWSHLETNQVMQRCIDGPPYPQVDSLVMVTRGKCYHHATCKTIFYKENDGPMRGRVYSKYVRVIHLANAVDQGFASCSFCYNSLVSGAKPITPGKRRKKKPSSRSSKSPCIDQQQPKKRDDDAGGDGGAGATTTPMEHSEDDGPKYDPASPPWPPADAAKEEGETSPPSSPAAALPRRLLAYDSPKPEDVRRAREQWRTPRMQM